MGYKLGPWKCLYNNNIFETSVRMSDWFMRRWDPFDLEWSLWRHFEEIDRLMDRSFRTFEKQMLNHRQKMLEEFKAEKKPAIKPESTSYTRE